MEEAPPRDRLRAHRRRAAAAAAVGATAEALDAHGHASSPTYLEAHAGRQPGRRGAHAARRTQPLRPPAVRGGRRPPPGEWSRCASGRSRHGARRSEPSAPRCRRWCWLFPGQGAQYAGMGTRPVRRATRSFAPPSTSACAALQPALPFDLRARMFADDAGALAADRSHPARDLLPRSTRSPAAWLARGAHARCTDRPQRRRIRRRRARRRDDARRRRAPGGRARRD